MLIAVGLVCQLRAAGVGAGTLRFHGHGSLLLSATEDLPQLEADDVPYLLTVRYFPVGHGCSFFLVGIDWVAIQSIFIGLALSFLKEIISNRTCQLHHFVIHGGSGV